MSDSDQEIAFRFAVDRVNSDRTVLPNTRLTAQIERIPHQDSFYAAKQGNSQALVKRTSLAIHFLVVVQLIHRLAQADISCTTTARLFFFPLLAHGRPTWPILPLLIIMIITHAIQFNLPLRNEAAVKREAITRPSLVPMPVPVRVRPPRAAATARPAALFIRAPSIPSYSANAQLIGAAADPPVRSFASRVECAPIRVLRRSIDFFTAR